MNCYNLLEQFIINEKLGINELSLIDDRIIELNVAHPDKADVEYSEIVIANSIIDSFKLNAENLKLYSDFCIKEGIQIGRRHKNKLLRYLNYRDDSDLEEFLEELSKENSYITKNKLLEKLNEIKPVTNDKAFFEFKLLWFVALEHNDFKKLGDYLFGIYSKLHAYYNKEFMTNSELLQYNLPFIKEDLSEIGKLELVDFCQKSSASFYNKYINILRKELQTASLSGFLEPIMNQEDFDVNYSIYTRILDRKGDLHYVLTEEYDAIYLKLNQDVFNSFPTISEFLNYVLDAIKQAYRILINNKVFAVEIENIYDGDRNIKWLLYAYVGVFSERFIKTKEHRKFFSPEKICLEMFNAYGYSIEKDHEKQVVGLLKNYYKNNNTKDLEQIYHLLKEKGTFSNFKKFVEEWEYVYYGFSFNDCYVIKNDSDYHEQFIKEIRNDNKILFLFYKYRMDERKIPCPICNGLNVSGNSYSEIGHRSWECKNKICPSRSKSNRGKRYSLKTNYMQFGAQSIDENNIISKEMISLWRRDIVSCVSSIEIYEMFVRYFSFNKEKVLFINCENDILDKLNSAGRNITSISITASDAAYCSEKQGVAIDSDLFDNYFGEGNYIARFLQNKQEVKDELKYPINVQMADAFIVNGDSYEVLPNLPHKCVSAAVTSPPYFNAREYSQWENIYLYYIDMYNIAKNVLHVLDDGGVFVYNIGDINGNEMTIAKSHMGIKRMLLGAYSILIFEKAGYELVENFIWDKGEPQSKRSTNDGNFTPHYQKPVNCYEHMFVFKRKGDILKTNEGISSKWQRYVVDFVPVYKINSKGENILGHTAPYPEDIPNLVVELFGKKDKFILDPFLGSGTTIIASAKNEFKGVGIEFSKEYSILSKERFLSECPGKSIKIV